MPRWMGAGGLGWSIRVARAVSQQEGRSLRGAVRSGGRRGSGSDFPAAWIWDWDLLLGRALSVLGAACRAGKVMDGWVAF